MLSNEQALQHPLWTRQLDLEAEMRSLGIKRFNDAAIEAKDKSQATRIAAVRTLMGHNHEKMVAAIERLIAAAESGKAGRKFAAYYMLKQVDDHDLVAHLAIRGILDGISGRETLTSVALDLANNIEDELHFKQFREKMPRPYLKFVKRAKKSTNEGYRRNTVLKPAKKIGMQFEEWPRKDKLLLGSKLIEMFVEETGLVRTERRREGSDNTPIYIEATPETLEWIEQEMKRTEWMAPMLMPTLIPPRPWSGSFEGGYWSGRVRRLTLVRTQNRQYLHELDSRNMPEVYGAINALQDTAWSVNRKVLGVMASLWADQSTIGLLPEANALPMPQRPAWLTKEMTKEDMSEEQLGQFRDWKRDCANTYDKNARLIGQRAAFMRMLWMAEKFAKEDEFYFPYQLDWRGRAYPVGLYLQPQGDDAQRGLLEFARSVPITDDDGAMWLAIHGAGCWGVDKVSFEDRVRWIEDHEEAILASARDPMENRFWTDAEKPWQALAFCFEWLGFKTEGYAYESCLPVQMDGTCNGLQNFSAILLDEIGGAAVNLVPADKPQDIYQQVADVVIKRVEMDAQEGNVEALAWLGNIVRKTVKRPVMTLAYGARRFGFVEMVFKDTIQPWANEKPEAFPFEGNGWNAALYLGAAIWDAVGQVVVAARSAMDWLQEAARVAAKHQLPVLWSTPSGFLVQQAYLVPNLKRIEMAFQKVTVRLSIESGGTRKIDARKQASGISPNWVHSLDASHMAKTVNRTHAEGIRSFSFIHDSYGTHAGNAAVLANCLREEFVGMYETDVLATFKADLEHQLPEGDELPPLPPKGSLDLSKVLESPFFFA